MPGAAPVDATMASTMPSPHSRISASEVNPWPAAHAAALARASGWPRKTSSKPTTSDMFARGFRADDPSRFRRRLRLWMRNRSLGLDQDKTTRFKSSRKARLIGTFASRNALTRCEVVPGGPTLRRARRCRRRGGVAAATRWRRPSSRRSPSQSQRTARSRSGFSRATPPARNDPRGARGGRSPRPICVRPSRTKTWHRRPTRARRTAARRRRRGAKQRTRSSAS
mmetsp:Transcript_2808/g.8295  ORF Transcript_2808/g.8295 Transcript_2808/m.8295 type:complete len:225 (-) Transcript_2808:191-865(-)